MKPFPMFPVFLIAALSTAPVLGKTIECTQNLSNGAKIAGQADDSDGSFNVVITKADGKTKEVQPKKIYDKAAISVQLAAEIITGAVTYRAINDDRKPSGDRVCVEK